LSSNSASFFAHIVLMSFNSVIHFSHKFCLLFVNFFHYGNAPQDFWFTPSTVRMKILMCRQHVIYIVCKFYTFDTIVSLASFTVKYPIVSISELLFRQIFWIGTARYAEGLWHCDSTLYRFGRLFPFYTSYNSRLLPYPLNIPYPWRLTLCYFVTFSHPNLNCKGRTDTDQKGVQQSNLWCPFLSQHFEVPVPVCPLVHKAVSRKCTQLKITNLLYFDDVWCLVCTEG